MFPGHIPSTFTDLQHIDPVSITVLSCMSKPSQTTSTGTLHTSTKARLTGVALRIQIRNQICDPDRRQNLIICSLTHCQSSLKMSCKSVWKFLHKQTDKQRRLHILLGGGNHEGNLFQSHNALSFLSPTNSEVNSESRQVCSKNRQTQQVNCSRRLLHSAAIHQRSRLCCARMQRWSGGW